MGKPIVITVGNQKGGIGKTTTSAALVHLLAEQNKGKRILLIDTDEQCNCCQKFGITTERGGVGMLGDLITNRVHPELEQIPASHFIQNSTLMPNVDVLAGGGMIGRSVYPNAFITMEGFNFFKDLKHELSDYAYVVIDTSPQLSSVTNSILMSADIALCPLEPYSDSVNGMSAFFSLLKTAKRYNPDLRFTGIFFNRVQDNLLATREIIPAVKESLAAQGYPEHVILNTRVPENKAAVGNSINQQLPVTYKYPVSKAAKAFKKLLKEVLDNVEE